MHVLRDCWFAQKGVSNGRPVLRIPDLAGIWVQQVGQHNEKRASYGHSLIVDPWGEVLADAGHENSPCIRTAEIGGHHSDMFMFFGYDIAASTRSTVAP